MGLSMVKKHNLLSSTGSLREQDPFLVREKQKYPSPLPSREFVLQVLAERGVPLSTQELGNLLSITEDEWVFFTRRLRAMAREGQVLINRRGFVCVAEKIEAIAGRVIGHRDGFGFFTPDEGGKDWFLSEREMKKVLHGDRVLVQKAGTDRRGRTEGHIIEVLERAHQTLVGRLHSERGVLILIPEDKRIHQDVLIEPNPDLLAQVGQVVVAELLVQPAPHVQPMGRVCEILGNVGDSGIEIEIALRKHALPYQFSAAALEQAQSTPSKVRKKDLKEREDLRHLPLVTIDGETARDFDDAVFAERQGKGWRLIVAIADVSHYVLPNDALDQDSFSRGNSVYFPRRVIPMLPEALSNGICSLNPQVERLCMVCDMQLSAKGKVKHYRFYPAVMKSQARLTYNQVWHWLTEGAAEAPPTLLPHLQHLFEVYRLLAANRQKRGAIDFDTVETQIVFNEQGKIDKIVPVQRNEAHRLIEECMLAANVCAAEFILQAKRKCLFRVHEGPTPEKLKNLRAFLKLSGLSLEGGDEPTTADYAQLAEQVKNRPDAAVLQTVMLRSMQQAVYTPEQKGHFGLAYEAYTHFTSPIRRYPDLLVHRTIKAILNETKYRPLKKWQEMGVQCSMTERRADEASREVETWLKCHYMQQHLGETFSGKVTAVTSFGLFILLDEIYTEGLVHISELGEDYFHHDAERHAIVGEGSGLTYRLGDTLQVKVARVDLDQLKIDFTLVKKQVPRPQANKNRRKRS